MKKSRIFSVFLFYFPCPPLPSSSQPPMMMMLCSCGHLGANLFESPSDDRTIAAVTSNLGVASRNKRLLAMDGNQSGTKHDDTGAEVMKEAIYANCSLCGYGLWLHQPWTRWHHALDAKGLMSRRPSLLITARGCRSKGHRDAANNSDHVWPKTRRTTLNLSVLVHCISFTFSARNKDSVMSRQLTVESAYKHCIYVTHTPNLTNETLAFDRSWSKTQAKAPSLVYRAVKTTTDDKKKKREIVTTKSSLRRKYAT
ncbi:hypothetical protein V8C42DRAFT_288816 [Trichoderma barbatum]